MRSRPKTSTLVPVLGFLLFVVATNASTTAAATLFVNPAGNDANDCLSPATACKTIQAAVNKAADRDVIRVAAGTYAEVVRIMLREGLTIQGEPGAVVVPPAGLSAGNLVSVSSSTGIRFEDFTLTGNGTAGGIAVDKSGVDINRCTVQDFGGGIFLNIGSTSRISDITIRRNRNHGLRVDANSHATVVGFPHSAGISVIEDNLFAGVISGPAGGSVLLFGSITIQRNQIGVLGEAMQVASCCGGGELKILNNRIGIQLLGGHLELRGPAFIEGNELIGVRLNGTSGSFSRFSADRVTVRNNGTMGNSDSAGIFLTGSHLDLFLADVVANASIGVLLQDNSSIRLFNTVVSDNGAEGVRLEGLSTARFFHPTTLRGNRGFDLSCTPNSFASGDGSGVMRMFCPGFDQSPRPRSQTPPE